MFSFFNKESELVQPINPDDEVIPLNAADDTDVLRSVVVVLSYRFDDCLDPVKLKNTFEELLDRPGWRKIGARLRKNAAGRLEYHIPTKFSEKRPIVSFSHDDYDMSVLDHAVAKNLPRPSESPSVQGDPNDFDMFTCSKDTPKTLNEYLTRDIPQIWLHVVTFHDSTMISISLPHTLTDGTGGAMMYKAWSLVLQGRGDEVPPFHAYDYDPLADFGEKATEPYIHRDKFVTGWRKWLFVAYQIYDAWRYKTSSRILCIPHKFLAEQRQKAIAEIRKETGDEMAFVSDNDVLVAWFTKHEVSGFNHSSSRTVRIMNAFALAAVLGNKQLPTSKAYISNAATEIYTFLKVKDFFAKPLSYAAWAIRQSMAQGATLGQVETLQAIKKNYKQETGESWPIFGDSSMEMMSYSNWTKGKYFETDFSGAIVREGSPRDQRPERPGLASMVQFNAWTTGFDLRNLMPIMGKDAGGNYWLQGPLRDVVWQKMERDLKAGNYMAD